MQNSGGGVSEAQGGTWAEHPFFIIYISDKKELILPNLFQIKSSQKGTFFLEKKEHNGKVW